MTAIQERGIIKVQEKISEIRTILDGLMYGQEVPVSDKEYERIKKAYDLICKVNDAL